MWSTRLATHQRHQMMMVQRSAERVKVYWDGEGRHFQGTVTERDQQGRVKVCYDDGDEHWEDNWSLMQRITPSDRSDGPAALHTGGATHQRHQMMMVQRSADA